MNLRHVVAVTIVLGIAACAASPPEQAASPKPTEPVAIADNSLTEDSPATVEDDLKVVDVPEVSKATVETNSQNSQLVCKYEKDVGSHMRMRVCRWKHDIEATRQQTQKDLRRMSTGTGGKVAE